MVEHLNILHQDEIEQLYGLPCFDLEQRDQYFYLEPSEQENLLISANRFADISQFADMSK